MAEQAYWEEIERYFAKKRGQALILSPKDWPLVNAWQERGLPLEIIYQGIDQAFARLAEKQATARRHAIRNLASCQAEVEELWNARQAAAQAKAEASPEAQRQRVVTAQRKFAAKIESVARQLRKSAETPHYQCIAHELAAAAATLDALAPAVSQAENAETLAQMKRNVRSLEQHVLARLEQAIAPEIRQELAAQAEAQLAAYQKNMTAEAYQETLRIAFLQALRDCYPLPAFL